MKRASDVPPVVAEGGRHAGHGGDGVGDDRAEPAWRRDERLARDLSCHVVKLAGRIEARTDDALEARAGEPVVEADIEARRCCAGNDVRGLVADVDRSKFQPARLKMVGPLVQRQSEQRIQQRNETGAAGCPPAPDRRRAPAGQRPGACR